MSDRPMQLLDRLTRHAIEAPDRLAVREIESGRTMTWRQLRDAVSAFASALRHDVPADGVVMLACPNSCNYHVAFLAALSVRLTVFPIHHEAVAHESGVAGDKTAAAGIIQSDLRLHRLAPKTESHLPAPALLLQSSGTTGLPKIACRDAASLDAVASNMVNALGIESTDEFLSCVPLSHSYGLEHGLLAPIWAGATTHLANGFDLATVRTELMTRDISIFPAVPSIYEMLANLPHEADRFFKLRLAYSAGGPLPMSIFARMREHYGIAVGQLYGATEIGSITFSHPKSPTFEPASVGRAMEGAELRFDDEEQLLVRATSMMSNYIGDESPLTGDGFFPTGDIGRLDEHGNLFITGRLKLLIDIGGLKVNPLEVEQAICDHPAVAACVVVPLRLSETVSRLKAIVTPIDPVRPPTAQSLRLFARERLTAHKVPRVFEVRPTLPRSATGKILRHLVESA